MNTFLNILALIFGILSGGLVLLRAIGAVTYSELQQRVDALRGIKRSFPLTVPLFVAIICWVWFIVKPLG